MSLSSTVNVVLELLAEADGARTLSAQGTGLSGGALLLCLAVNQKWCLSFTLPFLNRNENDVALSSIAEPRAPNAEGTVLREWRCIASVSRSRSE